MRPFILALLCLLLAETALSDTCVSPDDPTGGAVNNPVYIPPVVPDPSGLGMTHYQTGGAPSCGSPTSAGAACINWSKNFGCGPDGHPCGSSPQVINNALVCVLEGGSGSTNLSSGVCNNASPLGYSTFNSWKSDWATNEDSVWSADNGYGAGSVTRNSDGNVTALTIHGPEGTSTYSASAFDSLKRVTNATLPSGTVTYTYYPNSIRIYSRTDSNGTSYYAYQNDNALDPSTIIMPDGSIVFYGHDTSGNLQGINLQAPVSSAVAVDSTQPYKPVTYNNSPQWPLEDPAIPEPESLKGGCTDTKPPPVAAGGCQYALGFCMWTNPGPTIAPSSMAEWIRFQLCMISYGCGSYKSSVGIGRRL